MKLCKQLLLLLCAAVTICTLNFGESFAAAKKTKAKTTQTSKSRKGKGSKKNQVKRGTKSSNKGSKRNKGSKFRSRGRNVAKSTYKAPPKETPQNDSLTLAVNDRLLSIIPPHKNPGGLRVNSVRTNHSAKIASVGLNENFTYMPVTRPLIDSLADCVRQALPDSLAGYKVLLNVGPKSLAYYIAHVDKLPEKYRKNPAFVEEAHPLFKATKGMDNDIVALWHSHGRYYNNGSWQWQRPLLYETAEDLYTMSYILPYVVPMLENAGAYVMLPRERDVNRHEVIIDNDTNEEGQLFSQPYYKEMNSTHRWKTGDGEGFIYDLPDFRDTENPFENGTYREVQTQKGGRPSVAGWYADIPEAGDYAVYVSYKTLPNSTTDAHYTVNYSGGTKEYTVNQTMGGGTWIYLGTFPLEAGYSDTEPVVTLSNLTSGPLGTVVTADAVKIGGGMGNIARSPRRSDIYYDPSTPDNVQNPDGEETEEESVETEEAETGDDIADNANPIPNDAEKDTKSLTENDKKRGTAPRFTTSGMPRFLEGARYWLHWAGFPEYVYSPYHGQNDYKDDYTSRGHWVNYLAGGSRVLPGREGLNIPVDAVFALHSDAGKKDNDSFVGTLGIYFTQDGASYQDGTPRINSRMLTDMVMQQITNDVRRQYEPSWTRRSMWDKSYVEARVPEVPTTLIELMSHQNYADMVYGLDPSFRFTVGRAIYKGIARFLSKRKDRELTIQPLPVKEFSIKRTKAAHYRLNWSPTPDPLEPTAIPTKYVVMERSGSDLGFHKAGETKQTHFDIKVTDRDVHSFRIIAVNDGGASFPSETLSLKEGTTDGKQALVINGFTRVSAPGHHATSTEAGFDSETDFGVPFIRDISFTGHQTEFRRSAGNSAGRSNQNYAMQIIAGNTFDYAALHGSDITSASEMGFVSASAAAVESGAVNLSDYKLVDFILGKQKGTLIGNGKSGVMFKAFPEKLRKALAQYVNKGGNLIVSGQYVASDIQDSRSTKQDRDFASEVLGVEGVESEEAGMGRLRSSTTGQRVEYSSTLNARNYIVERPDVLLPAPDTKTRELLTFEHSGKRAGHIVDTGKGRVAVLSIPLESINDAKSRRQLVKSILKEFTKEP